MQVMGPRGSRVSETLVGYRALGVLWQQTLVSEGSEMSHCQGDPGGGAL